jgi:hypothetical protein
MLKYLYWSASAATLAMLLLEAPRGAWLTSAPEKGKVGTGPSGPGSARGGGPAFIWLGGGYRGGK